METQTRREEALVGTKAGEAPSCLFINAYLLLHLSSDSPLSLELSAKNMARPTIGFLSTSAASTSRPAFPAAPKFAESAVVAEPETTDIEAVVVSEDKPKREEIFAEYAHSRHLL
ncbi:unnamed protein product [Brassica napus]|uniref:(rape) hypothetical protein n=1 Tax=Brassica napus TaxID=3708 RepID=A0A816ZTP3_BRANA|nr:unnamed protein product [Brassica napus]